MGRRPGRSTPRRRVSPPTAERRPGKGGAQNIATGDDTKFTRIGVQLRARRSATGRCEPFAGHISTCFGGRDPLATCTCPHRPAAEDVVLADYCCSSIGTEQAAALGRLGRYCTETSCARLAAS